MISPADLLSLAIRLSHIPMLALKGKGANTHPFPDIVTRELFGRSGQIHLNSFAGPDDLANDQVVVREK